MANTAVLQSTGPYHASYLLTGDGTVAGPTIASAELLAAWAAGPLRNLWGGGAGVTYATQDAMRAAVLGGRGYCVIQLLSTPVDTTGLVNQVVVDVDTDAVTVTLPEINFGMSDTLGQLAMVHFVYRHSLVN